MLEKISGLYNKYKGYVSALDTGFLVLVLKEFSVQGVVFERGKIGGVKPVRFAEVQFETSVRSLKLKLTKIFEALGEVSTKNVLVVSEEDASCSRVEYDYVEVKKKFGLPGNDKVNSGNIKSELAMYLDYDIDEALFSYVKITEDDEENEDDDEENRREAFVFSAGSKIYDRIDKNLKIYGKKIKALSSEELFLFATQSSLTFHKGVFAVIEWKMYEFIVAVVKDPGLLRSTGKI